MASRAAEKRLTREYQNVIKSPPPFIVAHPSDSNILEWHYILTGPPETPYHNGQYWGTLIFPPNYPFAPPAIRMHTPSGRFQPSTRLCLTISDFHPKSFNPAWEVSTILIGLMSFMNSEEMTQGSVTASEGERKWAAARTRWWNSTGGGSMKEVNGTKVQKGNVKAGDGGAKFREQWPELDAENWQWMKENKIDAVSGLPQQDPSANCGPKVAYSRPSGSQAVVGAVVEGGREGTSWMARNKLLLVGGAIFIYVLIARLVGEGSGSK